MTTPEPTTTRTDEDLEAIEDYGVRLVASGAESHAEDDLNEDEAIADHLHQDACDFAVKLAHVIRDNVQDVLDLARRHGVMAR